MFLTFKDFNFKLAVINELMYNQELLTPRFDLGTFVENYTKREIDIDEEGDDIIPEVQKYFENFKIPKELANEITEISQDGGDEIYLQLCPFWDGEDDLFNIKSAVDAAQFPRLKKVTLFYDDKDRILDDFESQGISADWL